MRRRLATSLLALTLGAGVTAGLDSWRANYIERVTVEHFEREANQRVATAATAVERALASMETLKVFIGANVDPSPRAFDQLAVAATRTPGVALLIVGQRIAGSQRADFEAQWRQRYPDFTLRFRNSLGQLVRSPNRNDYVPIILGPNGPHTPFLLGLDIGADRHIGPIIGSLQLGEYRLSAPFHNADGSAAALLLTWQGVRVGEHLLGLVIQPESIVRSLPNNEAIQDVWFDVSDPSRAEAVYPAMFDNAAAPMRLLAAHDMNIGGRHWRLEARLADRMLPEAAALGQLQTWVLGMLLTVLATLAVWRLDRESADQTRELLGAVNAKLTEERDAAEQAAIVARRDGLRLQTILDTTSEAILLIDQAGHIERFNRAAENLFAYQSTEVSGANLGMLIPDMQRDRNGESYFLGIDQNRLIGTTREMLARKKDGSVFPIELSLNEFMLGETRYFVGVIRDVGDRKRAERMLFESEYKHRAILDAAHIGIYVLQDNQLRYVNPAFAGYFGRTPSDFIERRSLYDLIASAWHEALAVALDPERSGGRPAEVLMERPDGTRFYALITAKPILFDNRPGLAGSLLDISARKAAEEAMLRAEIRNVAILEAIPDLMLQLNAEGIVVDCRGRNGSHNFGLASDLVGQHFSHLPHAFATKLETLFSEAGEAFVGTFEYSLMIGRNEQHFEARLTPAGEGETLLMVRDISDRKRIEGELIQHRDHLADLVRERTAELNTLFAASPLPSALFSQDHFVEVNPAFETLFGYPRGELVGRSIARMMEDPNSKDKFSQMIAESLGDGGVLRLEARFNKADGGKVLCEVFGKSVDPTDPLAATIWIYQDIGERRAAEKSLRQAKEIAEMANLAKSEFLANMSHELRTPMHAVLSFAELGERRAGAVAPEKLVHYFSRIRQSGQRLLQILNDLLDLSKLEAGKMNYDMQVLNVLPVLREVADEFLPLARTRSLQIDVIAPDRVPEIRADALRLGQVLRNLVSNAIKFSPEGGTVCLRVYPESTTLVLMVEDEGVGIPPAELSIIFDKFIQSSETKTGAGGTGLGLAISREIVSAHNGLIRAENRETGGARFVVILPLHHKA